MPRRKKPREIQVRVTTTCPEKGYREVFGDEKRYILEGIRPSSEQTEPDLQPEASNEHADYGHPYSPAEEYPLSDEDRIKLHVSDSLERIWVSSDGTEAHYVQQAYDILSAEVIPRKLHFLGIRFVQYADKKCLVSWCSDPECKHGCHSIATCFQQADFPDVSAEQHQIGVSLSCPFSETAVKIASLPLSAPSQLEDVFKQSMCLEDEEQVLVEYIRQDQHYILVRCGPDFHSWGAVQIRGNGQLLCRTCSGRHCKHRSTVADKTAHGALHSTRLSAPAFQEKLSTEFDFEKGERKLNCISTSPIPPDGPHPVSAGRANGSLTLPTIVRPNINQTCTNCGKNDWGAGIPGPSCSVFMLAAMQQTVFVSHTCQTGGCSGQLIVDGIDIAVLRKTQGIAFAHEILWDWSVRGSTSGVSWFGHWRDTLARYSDSAEQKSEWQFRLRDLYEQATLDFVQLQHRDYDALFSCGCNRGYTADGITLGFHMNQMFLVSPVLPHYYTANTANSEVSQEQPRCGSTFEQRVFFRQPQIRKAMLALTTTGLPELEVVALKAQLQAARLANQESTVLPFLEELEAVGNVFQPQDIVKVFLYCLSTAAPVCQILKPAVFALCERWQRGEQLHAAEQIQIIDCCPFLQPLMRIQSKGNAAMKLAIPALLKAMLQVSRRAFMPATQPPRNTQRFRPKDPTALNHSVRPPISWSREEAFLTTGHWFGVHDIWQPSSLGGSDVVRPLRLYAADSMSFGTKVSCTKLQSQHKKLTPGCMIYCCTECEKCCGFSLMADAESPRTVMEALYTRWHIAPESFCFDNGCNLYNYILNREPEHFQHMQMFVDEMHFAGHKQCSPAFSTGNYHSIKNSSLPEQKNAFLDRLRSQGAYMKQTTFLWYVRYFLSVRNQFVDSPPFWHEQFKRARLIRTA